MSYSNNYKKWCENDIIFFDNYIRKENIIDSYAITFLSNMLKRTDIAIIYRIFKNYIEKEFDFIYYNNDNIYDKYIFYNEVDIDNFLIKKFTKKQKIKFKLNKINNIILNLIVDDNIYKKNLYYSIVHNNINEIYNLNNPLKKMK